jgi:prevent-host-death family protein
MHTLSLFDAKTHLSRIVEELVQGREDSVVVSRRGKPVVKIVPIKKEDAAKRIGAARGKFDVPDDMDALNPVIADLFSGTGMEE